MGPPLGMFFTKLSKCYANICAAILCKFVWYLPQSFNALTKYFSLCITQLVVSFACLFVCLCCLCCLCCFPPFCWGRVNPNNAAVIKPISPKGGGLRKTAVFVLGFQGWTYQLCWAPQLKLIVRSWPVSHFIYQWHHTKYYYLNVISARRLHCHMISLTI